jgi:hypothetical protein
LLIVFSTHAQKTIPISFTSHLCRDFQQAPRSLNAQTIQ